MSSRHLKILVADDDSAMRELIVTICRDLGHDADSAEDGKVCLKKMAAAPPDILFLDLVMPVLDGVHVLKTLREKELTTTIIAISSLDDSEVIASILHAGAAAFLIKPLNEAIIREVIGRVASGTIFGPSSIITETSAADGNARSST